MIDWAPFAIRRDPVGPAQAKHGYNAPEPGHKDGLVVHSMVGALGAALNRLDGPDRASWTFSNPKAGPLLQHYPVGFHTWASGSPTANIRFVSIEHEGGGPGNYSEPLTESQIKNLVDLISWLESGFGWKLRRPDSDTDVDATAFEHRECVRFGSAPTACPSGRLDGLWGSILQQLEDDVTKEEVQAMLTFTAAVLRNEIKAGFDQQGNLLKLSLTDLDARVKELEKR